MRPPEQSAQEAARPFLLRGRGNLAQLALQLFDLGLGVPQREILHDHRLGQHVRRVGPFHHELTDELFGLRVLLLRGNIFDALGQGAEKLPFLGVIQATSGSRSTRL